MNCDKCNIEMQMEKFDTASNLFTFKCKKCGTTLQMAKEELENIYNKKYKQDNKN